METIKTKIVGVTFEGRQELIKKQKEGNILFLQRENNNKHDPNAVKVISPFGEHLGYLNKELAAEVAEAMDKRGVVYFCEVLDVTGGEEVSENHSEKTSYGCNIQFINLKSPSFYLNLPQRLALLEQEIVLSKFILEAAHAENRKREDIVSFQVKEDKGEDGKKKYSNDEQRKIASYTILSTDEEYRLGVEFARDMQEKLANKQVMFNYLQNLFKALRSLTEI